MMLTADPQRSWRLAAGFCILVVIIALFAMIPPTTLPYPPASEFSDASVSHWPAAHFLRTSVLDSHSLPLWNPLRMLGQPFAANPLNKVWYPPQWLVLLLPPTLHLNALIYLHGAWLLLGILAWARRADLHPVAGITAALAWALAPKLIAHLGAGHLDLWYAASWVGWLLWSLTDARTTRRIILIAIIAAMLTLADLRMAFYMIPAALLYAVLNRATSRRLLLALPILIGLTAVQLVPLITLSSSLTRSEITPAQAAEFSLPPQMLIGTLIPDSGGFHEYLTYLGIPVIALALLSLRHSSRRVIIGWWATAALSLLWSLGDHFPLFPLITRLIPIASWFRVPSRAWFVVALAFAILSAYGLDALIQHGLPRRARLIGVAAAFAGLLWTLASALMLPLPTDLRPAVISFGIVMLVTGASLWIAVGLPSIPTPRARLIAAYTLAAAGILSYLLLAPTLIDARPVASPTPAHTELAMQCNLVYSPTFALLDPPAAASGIRTLHTADPFQLKWSAQAIAEAANVPYSGYTITSPPIPTGEPDASTMTPIFDALSALGVTAIIAPRPNPLLIRLSLHFNNDLYLMTLPSHNLPLRTCGLGPNRYEFEIKPSMILVNPLPIAMAWSPDWRADLNGQPIPTARVNDALLGVDLPRGSEGTLTIRYQPAADYLGMAITAITILSIAILWWRTHG